MKRKIYIIGIDEVGRGSLAGPVTVAVVAMSADIKIFIPHQKLKLKDSKQLTENQREAWFEHVKNCPKIYRTVANVYSKAIDRINISRAANLAATRAFKKLIVRHLGAIARGKIFLDGGLFLNNKTALDVGRFFEIKTIIRADEKYNCVKLASIVAKVTRDRLMKRNHKKFPSYNFEQHKGYGTKAHVEAIKKYGLSSIHRQSFVKNIPLV